LLYRIIIGFRIKSENENYTDKKNNISSSFIFFQWIIQNLKMVTCVLILCVINTLLCKYRLIIGMRAC